MFDGSVAPARGRGRGLSDRVPRTASVAAPVRAAHGRGPRRGGRRRAGGVHAAGGAGPAAGGGASVAARRGGEPGPGPGPDAAAAGAPAGRDAAGAVPTGGAGRPGGAARAHRRGCAARSAELSERDARMLLMREEGFKYAEIAEVLGVKSTSVGALVARALKRFAKAYESLETRADGTSD